MKPLLVLGIVFILVLIVNGKVQHVYDYAFSGRIAMSVMLVFTGIAHFIYTEGMVMMIPDLIPYKKEVVYLTGVLEFMAALGLLLPSFRIVTAWMLILFFLAVLPANIYAAINQVDFQQASFSGEGVEYLWLRVPLQVLFIAWVYFSAIRPRST